MEKLCASLLHIDRKIAASTSNGRYCVVFGASLKVFVLFWLRLEGAVPIGTQPDHLVRGLAFLKMYETERFGYTYSRR